jgi:hypothetical protein
MVKIYPLFFGMKVVIVYFCRGEMAERSNAAVLKTVDCHRSGGSNPSLSALSLKILFALQIFNFAGLFVSDLCLIIIHYHICFKIS